MTGLVKYDQMVSAIAECHRLDEALAIRDRHKALPVYKHQMRNVESERQLAQIRLRAERRIGELLEEAEQAGTFRGGRGGDRRSSSAKELDSLASFGIKKKQAMLFRQVAKIPRERFEEYVTSGKATSVYTALRKEALRKADKEYAMGQWRGMPEFVQEDLAPRRTIHVHFQNEDDVATFAELVGQNITPKTRFIWFPEAEIGHTADRRYVDAPESSTEATL